MNGIKLGFLAIAGMLCLSSCADSPPAGVTATTAERQVPAVQSEPDWQTIKPGGDTSCSDGSDYAFHVKRGDPDKVFIFLNGGGACWDARTCETRNGNQTFVPRVDLPHNHPRNHGGIFNFSRTDNPARDWTLVFVPYCTGDIHLGAKDAVYEAADGQAFTIRHRGAVNAQSALDWVSGNYSPQQIVVSGASAGALSAPVYAEAMREKYPAADIVQFAGGASGYNSPAANPILRQWAAFDALPTDRLSAIDRNTAGFYSFYLPAKEGDIPIRSALYDSNDDKVQVMFRRLTGDQGSLGDSIRATYAEIERAAGPTATFLASGDDHTILRFDHFYTRQVGGVFFSEWFAALLNGEVPADADCAADTVPCKGAK